MGNITITNQTIHVDVDAPEPLPSIARIVRTVEWPTQRTIKIAGLFFTAYKLYHGVLDESTEILQDMIELAVLFASGYSIKLVQHLSASGTGCAEGAASMTNVS